MPPAALAERYVVEGFWDSRSLGRLIGDCIDDGAALPFVVHSAVRPWRGTIGDVFQWARSFAAWLKQRRIGPGSVVVMQLPNWMEAAVCFWGAAYAGVVVVPVVHFYGAKELDHILRTVKASLLVTPDRFGATNYVDNAADLVSELGLSWAVVATSESRLPSAATPFTDVVDSDPLDAPVAVEPDEPAIVAFTSGTTQNPKGVIHSHRSIGFEARQSAGISPNTGPPPLVAAPVGHFMGMLSALLGSLLRGVPIHLLDVWSPAQVLRLMTEEKVSVSGGAPYFFVSLLDHPDFTADHLRHMPHAGLGGSPVPLTFARKLAGLGIDVMRCYGSTEHPTITGCTFSESAHKRMMTDGHPLAGVEVRLDENGQIFSRGPDLFLGYTDSELTAAALDDEGWYRTGDVGVIDDEGFLTITDRISDVIIRGGENISAQEVEDLLLGLPGVSEAVVVAAPDEQLGERAVAVFKMAGDAPGPDLADIRAHLSSAGLAKQKWPESVRVVTDFPRTASGKVQKFRLRAYLRDGSFPNELV